MAETASCETCCERNPSATIRPNDKVECNTCWLNKNPACKRKITRKNVQTRQNRKYKMVSKMAEKEANRRCHGRQHSSQAPALRSSLNMEEQANEPQPLKPSLTGLRMKVPLSFLRDGSQVDSDDGAEEWQSQVRNCDDQLSVPDEIYTHKINIPEVEVYPNEPNNNLLWGDIIYQEFINQVEQIYGEIIHFRKNIFNIPLGKAGKEYNKELTFWIRQFNSPNSHLNSIA